MASEREGVPGEPDAVRSIVREEYGRRVSGKRSSCCGEDPNLRSRAEQMGYEKDDLDRVPEDANLGLGCGNPAALAALKPGEVVVDLGAGGGLDAFLAAGKVGAAGRVIGIDMTPEMLERARIGTVKAGLTRTVEFREGIIEALPVVSGSADVVISNCVINLSPDKPQVFREAFRVLKNGGRIAVSDILLSEPLPEEVTKLASAYAACIGGALVAEDYLAAIEAAGFVDVRWTRVPGRALLDASSSDPISREITAIIGEDRVEAIRGTIWSYKIEARKP